MNLTQQRVDFFRTVWSNLCVPVRPGPEGLALYRAQMQRFPEKHVLVLGATPELVDMALELRADTVVSVERDPEIMEAMRRLGTRDWSGVRMIAGDWLEARPDWQAAFNCVVCDGGLLFLEHPGQWDRLFMLVHGWLRPGGVFVAKEWAEPAGDRDYETCVAGLIASFEAASRNRTREENRRAFIRLASELRLATFIKATHGDGAFDQGLLLARLTTLIEALERRFPDPALVEIAHAALKYLARSRPGTTDVITGVTFDGAERLLARNGFRAAHSPLPDAPVPGANYMFVAEK